MQSVIQVILNTTFTDKKSYENLSKIFKCIFRFFAERMAFKTRTCFKYLPFQCFWPKFELWNKTTVPHLFVLSLPRTSTFASCLMSSKS